MGRSLSESGFPVNKRELIYPPWDKMNIKKVFKYIDLEENIKRLFKSTETEGRRNQTGTQAPTP